MASASSARQTTKGRWRGGGEARGSPPHFRCTINTTDSPWAAFVSELQSRPPRALITVVPPYLRSRTATGQASPSSVCTHIVRAYLDHRLIGLASANDQFRGVEQAGIPGHAGDPLRVDRLFFLRSTHHPVTNRQHLHMCDNGLAKAYPS